MRSSIISEPRPTSHSDAVRSVIAQWSRMRPVMVRISRAQHRWCGCVLASNLARPYLPSPQEGIDSLKPPAAEPSMTEIERATDIVPDTLAVEAAPGIGRIDVKAVASKRGARNLCGAPDNLPQARGRAVSDHQMGRHGGDARHLLCRAVASLGPGAYLPDQAVLIDFPSRRFLSSFSRFGRRSSTTSRACWCLRGSRCFSSPRSLGACGAAIPARKRSGPI